MWHEEVVPVLSITFIDHVPSSTASHRAPKPCLDHPPGSPSLPPGMAAACRAGAASADGSSQALPTALPAPAAAAL